MCTARRGEVWSWNPCHWQPIKMLGSAWLSCCKGFLRNKKCLKHLPSVAMWFVLWIGNFRNLTACKPSQNTIAVQFTPCQENKPFGYFSHSAQKLTVVVFSKRLFIACLQQNVCYHHDAWGKHRSPGWAAGAALGRDVHPYWWKWQ